MLNMRVKILVVTLEGNIAAGNPIKILRTPDLVGMSQKLGWNIKLLKILQSFLDNNIINPLEDMYQDAVANTFIF